MTLIDARDHRSARCDKVRCNLCKRTWKNKWWFLMTSGTHNLSHIIDGEAFTVR